MSEFILVLTFVMTLMIPVIAIIAELSHTTPNSVSHSIVRSIICLACIVFLSQIIQPSYKPYISHFLSIGFIFIVSCAKLYLELNEHTVNKFIFRDHKNDRIES
jgi:phosphate/sulfate permease